MWETSRGRVRRLFPRAGFQLGRFQVLLQDMLGSGASSSVWLCGDCGSSSADVSGMQERVQMKQHHVFTCLP